MAYWVGHFSGVSPTDTQYKTEDSGEWEDAETFDKLGDGYQSRSETGSDDYEIKLGDVADPYDRCKVTFDNPITVLFTGLSGTVIYRDDSGAHTLETNGTRTDVEEVETQDDTSSVNIGGYLGLAKYYGENDS